MDKVNESDEEWVKLILEANKSGLSIQKIHCFFKVIHRIVIKITIVTFRKNVILNKLGLETFYISYFKTMSNHY